MKPFQISLPAGSTAVGEILDDYSKDPDLLSEDIYQAMLPNGVGVDVGWYPRFDPNGEFVITVFRDDFDSPLVAPIREKKPRRVAGLVERLAAEHSGPKRKIKALSRGLSRQK